MRRDRLIRVPYDRMNNYTSKKPHSTQDPDSGIFRAEVNFFRNHNVKTMMNYNCEKRNLSFNTSI